MKNFNFISVKRVFLSRMRYCEERTHEQTLEAANQIVAGEYSELKGVIGKSPFFEARNFNVITDIIPEPMHLLDGGFAKALASRMFNSGSSQQSEPGYRRTSIAQLTKRIE